MADDEPVVEVVRGMDGEGIIWNPVHGLLGSNPWIPGATFRAHPGLAEWLALAVQQFMEDEAVNRDRALCPYWLSQAGLSTGRGSHGPNTCASGCWTEPVCITG
jgi:hypothetical protein